MGAVYAALLPLPCALSRAWPQAAQGLPALTFSLADWRREGLGLTKAQLRLAARAALPEEADELAAQAISALEPLGLRLSSARDEAEADTGVFLKTLLFEGQLWEGLPQKLELSVKAGEDWLQVGGLYQLSFSPGERRYQDIRPLSAAQAQYAPGEKNPAVISVEAAPRPEDPGQGAIAQAFLTGQPLVWRLQGGAWPQTQSGRVTSLLSSALGFSARILITQ